MMRVSRASVLFGLACFLVTALGDAEAVTIYGQLGDGNYSTFSTFSFSDGNITLHNGNVGPTEFTPGVASQAGNTVLILSIEDPTTGSGSASFVYENTLTLNGVTQSFSRTIDVTWGPPDYTGTEVTLHSAEMEFDLGADGIVPAAFYEQSLRCGTNCSTTTPLTLVPEPSTALLVAGGLLALCTLRTRDRM